MVCDDRLMGASASNGNSLVALLSLIESQLSNIFDIPTPIFDFFFFYYHINVIKKPYFLAYGFYSYYEAYTIPR